MRFFLFVRFLRRLPLVHLREDRKVPVLKSGNGRFARILLI